MFCYIYAVVSSFFQTAGNKAASLVNIVNETHLKRQRNREHGNLSCESSQLQNRNFNGENYTLSVGACELCFKSMGKYILRHDSCLLRAINKRV